jgi:hypothetical protein
MRIHLPFCARHLLLLRSWQASHLASVGNVASQQNVNICERLPNFSKRIEILRERADASRRLARGGGEKNLIRQIFFAFAVVIFHPDRGKKCDFSGGGSPEKCKDSARADFF